VTGIRGDVQVKSPMQPGDILLPEKLLFSCNIELQNIYCLVNPNQLYVKYICFVWFEYFRVCLNISRIVSEYSIVCCMFWDEILKCLEKYDLSAWYSKAIFTGQAQNIEHVA